MAEPGRRKAVQRAHSSNHVTLGQFGTAGYDNRTKKWSFLREDWLRHEDSKHNEKSSHPFKLVRGPTRVIPPPQAVHASTHDPNRLSANSLSNLVPDAACVQNYLESAAASSHGQHRNKAATLNLIAFGSALILGSEDLQSGLQTTPIAAFVDAANFDRLILFHLNSELVSINNAANRHIHVPSISSTDSSSWFSPSGPILEIHFSARSSPHEATWLAVRHPAALSIFRPLIHRTMVTAINRSTLDHNLIVEIPASRTGGLPLSHAVFNPRDPRMIAVIDVGGNWSVWKTKGRRSKVARILYRAELKSQGTLVSEPRNLKQFDGWHKIGWANCDGDEPDRILIANREAICLFGLDGSAKSVARVRIGSRPGGWVLDLISTDNHDTFYVLTETHIYLLAVDMVVAQKSQQKVADAMRVILSWDHSRGQSDKTLKMYQLDLVHTRWLFLSSVDTGLITAYQLKRRALNGEKSFNISDPILIHMPIDSSDKNPILAIQVVSSESSVSNKQSADATYCKYFSQDSLGSLNETLFSVEAASVTSTLPLPRKKLLQHKSTNRLMDDTLEDDIESFIAPDNENKIEESHSQEEMTMMNTLLKEPTTEHGATDDSDHSRRCNLRMTYTAIATQTTTQKMKDTFLFKDLLGIISKTLQDMSTSQTFLQLLSEVPASQWHTTDVEDDSHTLALWLDELEEREGKFGRYQWHSQISKQTSLIDLYHDFVEQWLSTLPGPLPDRIRVQRERLIRQIAFEYYSSRIMIVPGQGRGSDQVEELHQVIERTGLSSQMQDLAVETQPSSPILPNIASSSQPAPPLASQPSLLSLHLDFKQPSLTTKSQSRVNNVLAHLPLSSDFDPSAYSYSEVELNLTLAQNEIFNSATDPKARRKAERLSRARKRQFERQSQIKKTAHEQTNMLPSVLSSQLPIRGVQSSQGGPAVSSQPSLENVPAISMTQPERGAHGKRDAKKAKVKGKVRQKGF